MKRSVKPWLKRFFPAIAAAVLLLCGGALAAHAASSNWLMLDQGMEHGTVIVENMNIDRVSAPDGMRISLKAQPEEGYALKEWHVYYRHNNQEIPVYKYNDALEHYYFTIPSTNRTVKYIIIGAVFESVNTVPFEVKVYSPDNAERGSYVAIDHADGMYFPGETVTVTIHVADGSVIHGKGIFESYYYDVDKKEEVTFGNFPDFTQVDENTYTFRMPAYDVRLNCVFGAALASVRTEKFFVEEGRTGAEMSAEELGKYSDALRDPSTYMYIYNPSMNRIWKEDNTYPKEIYTNDQMRLEYKGYASDPYLISDIRIVYTRDGETVTESIVDWNNVGPNRELTAYFTMPGVETTILYTVDRVRRVQAEECDMGRIVPSLTRAIPGDVVTLTPEPTYTWECVGLSVKDSDGNELLAEGARSFTMPDGDVTVSGSWQKEYINRQIHFVDTEDGNKEWDLYYDDAYFLHSSTEYDEHLSTLSMFMTAFSMNPGGPGNKDNLQWYQQQPNRVKGFFDAIGFTAFEANADYYARTGFDTIGIAIASRKAGDYTVIAVVPRSGGYYLEWGNNVWLGDGTKSNYMHEGWYNAANKLIAFLQSYVEDHDIRGNVKLWMAGYSRGGAVVNLAAGILDNRVEVGGIPIGNGIHIQREDLFAYTFEAPQGANVHSSGIAEPKSFVYNNIWNIINPNDLVPKVAMSQMGFTRFGQDRFIETEFFNPTGHNLDRIAYGSLYAASHNGYGEDESNAMTVYTITGEHYVAAMSGLPQLLYEAIASWVSGEPNFVSKDYTKENYDANIVSTIVLEEMMRVIGTRENYVQYYQSGISALCMAAMSDDKDADSEAMEMLIDGFIMAGLGEAMGCVVPLGIVITQLIDEALYDPDTSSIQKTLIHVVKEIFKEKPTELVTFALNIGNIFANHGTGASIAHVQAQDFYYIDAYNDTYRYSIRQVPLHDNADMGRISFYGYNDLQVEKNGKTMVNVFGEAFGKSGISCCEDGYAVGYYSYAFCEKMEFFFPVRTQLVLTMMSHSKQISHEISYTLYHQYNSLGYGPSEMIRYKLDEFIDTCSFNSDTKTITVYVD